MKHALEVDPLSSNNHAEFGWMNCGMNDFDNSIKLASESIELDPNNPFAYFVLGEGYSGKGMFKKAIEAQKKSARLSPFWKWGLAKTYALAGNRDETFKILDELKSDIDVWDTWCLAVIYSAVEDKNKMFYWLEQAFKRRHPYIQWMKGQKYFELYKEDPRYIDLAKRMNLSD
jgi:tetratricopeptide (TPR) repeat protein